MPSDKPAPDLIERAYKVRLRLTRSQQHTLHRLFGATRFVWNWALQSRTTAYRERAEQLNWIALSKQLTSLKTTPGTQWLAALPREPFNQVLRDQEKAFASFFAKRSKYPRCKRRGQQASVRFTLDQRRAQVERTDGTVLLPGLGSVRFKQTYGAMAGRLRSITLSRDAADRYFASFTADQVPAPVQSVPAQASVGIDLGLNPWATLSTGETIAAPKALAQKLKRLRRYQRCMSRKRDAALRAMGLD
ncbi:MAG: RNA-guided endonuclease InsQ/TnpB family protein, partial [Gammaproteobacteria bacterium]